MTELGIVDLSALQEEKERSEESFHVLSKQLHDINNKIQMFSFITLKFKMNQIVIFSN